MGGQYSIPSEANDMSILQKSINHQGRTVQNTAGGKCYGYIATISHQGRTVQYTVSFLLTLMLLECLMEWI